jgi:arsenate reductase-like glutaredoxin family protein
MVSKGAETFLFLICQFLLWSLELKTMASGIPRSNDRLSKGIDPEELARWCKTCETAAKKLCNDKLHDITLRSQGRKIDVSLKDEKSADCLVKAIEINLSSMPLFVQSVFIKLASDLREAKFDP